MAELTESFSSTPTGDMQTSYIQGTKISSALENKKYRGRYRFKKMQETHRHEEDMMKYGWFGIIFGAEENSFKALTFTLLFLIILVWIGVIIGSIWLPDLHESAFNFIKGFIPIFTLAFGYFFGKK